MMERTINVFWQVFGYGWACVSVDEAEDGIRITIESVPDGSENIIDHYDVRGTKYDAVLDAINKLGCSNDLDQECAEEDDEAEYPLASTELTILEDQVPVFMHVENDYSFHEDILGAIRSVLDDELLLL